MNIIHCKRLAVGVCTTNMLKNSAHIYYKELSNVTTGFKQSVLVSSSNFTFRFLRQSLNFGFQNFREKNEDNELAGLRINCKILLKAVKLTSNNKKNLIIQWSENSHLHSCREGIIPFRCKAICSTKHLFSSSLSSKCFLKKIRSEAEEKTTIVYMQKV